MKNNYFKLFKKAKYERGFQTRSTRNYKMWMFSVNMKYEFLVYFTVWAELKMKGAAFC